MEATWTLQERVPGEEATRLAGDLAVPPIVARLLWGRGVRDAEEGRRFLYPSLDHLHDPFLLAGMDRAVATIAALRREGGRIGLFGDFDVDGVSGTALLYRFFQRAGIDVTWRLPKRLTEGYDLSRPAVADLAAGGATLLLTVDSGIGAVESVAYARSLGMEVIVTDHHPPKGPLPGAAAVLDPKRADCAYPYEDLAGVGIAFKLAEALTARGIGDGEDLLGELDLVAIGTIADVVRLTGENRVLVRAGLSRLAATEKPGLRRLIEVSGFQEKRLDHGAVAFGIAPRLNAAGRLGEADPAFELLTTRSDAAARETASLLDRMNAERRALDERTLEEALGLLGGEKDGAIVLASEKWHPGVIGIVASRLKEKHGVPAVLIALDKGVGRGSARSVAGFPLDEALRHCDDLLLRHGGHALAAGLSIEERQLGPFRARFRSLFEGARERVPPPGSLTIDEEISLADCDPRLVEALALLKPFGSGNRRPIFLARDVTRSGRFRPVGRDHLKFRLSGDGNALDAIAFRAGHEKASVWGALERFDVAFSLEENRWGGLTRLQLNVKAIRPVAP